MKYIAAFMVVLTALLAIGCGNDAPVEEPVAEEPVVEEVQTALELAGCVDSDGGEDFNEAGEVFDAKNAHGADTCSKSYVYENRLYEYTCNEEGQKVRIIHTCENACENGACVA